MGERGAHLTANLQIKPSIFEFIAADSLNSTFYPAIKKIINFLVIRNPEKYTWTNKYYDEIFLLFNGTLQYYYLKTNHGSLSEVFYGICRYSTVTDNFTRTNHNLSFFSICLLPYIKIKIDEYFSNIQLQEDNGIIIENYNKIKYLEKTYKIIISLYEFIKVIQYIAYISNNSVSHTHTPLLRLINIGLKYIQTDDTVDWTWSDLFNGKIKTAAILSGLLFRGLELSAFFLQFLQWWQLESSQKNITNLPIPPPPVNDPDGHKYLGICPICLQKWITPIVISISGFVYCYKCIMIHFKDSKTCPVTGYPAGIDDIIRIYDE